MKFFSKKSAGLKIFLFAIVILLFADALLNKGMLRVMLPKEFPPSKIAQPQPIHGYLINEWKNWVKAVNTPALMNEVPAATPGIEMDIYFKKTTGSFEVHHDPDAVIDPPLDSLLETYRRRKLNASIWLDFKNLDTSNMNAALQEVIHLRQKFNLGNKLIIESPFPEYLQVFNKEGFYTSYYTAYFNPYLMDGKEVLHYADSITALLKINPVHAVSGYYYQYTFLKKYFSAFPILTWTDKEKISLVDLMFRKRLAADSSIKIVLRPL